jgi:hypothetical protein
MKNELIKKLQDWTQEKADDFHNHRFLDIGEDNKYIWEKTEDGFFLWKDINALFFSQDGKIYKLSSWSTDISWDYFVKTYDNKPTSIRMEIPLHYEKINDLNMGYSIVQRPGNQQGSSFIELIFENRITTDFIIELIENYMNLRDYFKILNQTYGVKFPFPPKLFVDNDGFFWADFKYWKYKENDFVKFFFIGLERYLDVLIESYHLDIDKVKIKKEIVKHG